MDLLFTEGLHDTKSKGIVKKKNVLPSIIDLSVVCFLPHQGHLYVGTAMEVQRLPLADCSRYGDTCRECILSRDPYCGWDRVQRKCIPIPPGYNATTGYDWM